MIRTQRFVLFVLLGLLAAAVSMPAFALDLDGARRQGLIGEKADGYVAVVKSAAGVDALAADVNARRKEEYVRISKVNGQPVNVVGQLAAKQIISGLPAGALYQDGSGGGWKKR